MRTRAFGPTPGRALPTPGGGARNRPVTDLSSLMTDTEPDYTATPRPQTQPYQFTPISQLPGGSSGAPSTGEEGGEAPPSVASAPLVSPSAQGLATLQRRVAQSGQPATGPNDAQEAFTVAGSAAKGVKTGAQGAKLLDQLLSDAGFAENARAVLGPSIRDFLTLGPTGASSASGLTSAGGVLDPAKFNFTAADAGDVLQSLGNEGAFSLSGAGNASAASSGLEGIAPYLSALVAALNVGNIASSDNLSSGQKAVGASGAALGALASPLAGAAASAAGMTGATAGAAAGAAAPVAMILADIASAIMEAMQHVPHAAREALDYFHSRDDIGVANETIDKSFTLDDLSKNLIRQTSGNMGGGYPGQQSAFITYLDDPSGSAAGRRFLGTGSRYPMVTLADLLNDPQHAGVSWQHGLSNQYLDPTNAGLTGNLRKRLDLLGRVQKGDPEARMALELAKARYASYVRQRTQAQQNYEESQRMQASEFANGSTGTG